jgi:hypothetical protein
VAEGCDGLHQHVIAGSHIDGKASERHSRQAKDLSIATMSRHVALDDVVLVAIILCTTVLETLNEFLSTLAG